MTSTPLQRPPAGSAGPVEALGEAVGLVDQVAETLWAARSGAELTATIQAVALLRAKLDAVEVAVVHELDAGATGREALRQAGWASVNDYLTHTTGARRGYGPATVKLARRLEQFPALMEALAAGEISRAKATVVAAAVERLPVAVREDALSLLLHDAGRLCVEELDHAGRHILEVVDPDGVDTELERSLERTERAAHLSRTLAMRFDKLGGGDGTFAGSAEDLLLLKTVLLSLAAPQPAEPGGCGGEAGCTDLTCTSQGHTGRDPRDHGARMFDALIELARLAQATGALPDCHGAVPQLTITMDLDTLRTEVGAATTTLGEDLTARISRRLACDADLIPAVLGADSAILDVGRTQRLVTAALWTVLVLRDHHCAFPGCRRPPVMCHAHHIRHWVDGGATSIDNLVLLCGTHHRILHTTPWQLRLSTHDQRPEFKPPDRHEWIRQRPRDG